MAGSAAEASVTVRVPVATGRFAPGARARWVRRLGVRGLVGFWMLLAVILVALLAPVLAPYDYAKQDYEALLHAPSLQHPLGTDNLGRDVLSRIIIGAQVSVKVGILAVILALALGILLGLPSGYFGGAIDRVINGLLDALLAFPALVLALSITAVLGPGENNLVVAIGITSTPAFARLLRAQVLVVREQDYVLAARSLGANHLRLALRHVFPNSMTPLLVQFSLSIGFAMLTEAGLSFLGLGVQPPQPSWGSMLREGYSYASQAPWFPVSAGMAITLAVLGANFLGDGLRDLLDVRLRGVI